MNIGLGLLNVVSQSTSSSQNKENNTEKDLSEKEKTILENLYRCRDLELNNLWQKSIFLGPFLILCFTGYGILLSSMISNGQKDTEVLFKYNFLCLALCLVSIIFSMLWIYMFKGSKAQYELCERAITHYEQRELNIPYGYAMGTLKHNEIEFDDNLLSTKAGKFSPSKINILIGQVSLWIWIYCFFLHLLMSFNVFNLIYTIGIVVIVALLSYIVPSFLLEKIKSSYLSLSDEERYIREVLKRNKNKDKDKNEDKNEIASIISSNTQLLQCLQKIYETENKVIPLFTEKEKIYLDACRYLVELGEIGISKQEELENIIREKTGSTMSIDLKLELSSLASALGIEEKQIKELKKYIGEKFQK